MACKDEEQTVCLLVENEKICCCKGDLTQASKYFEAMFNSNMQETRAQEIQIQGVSARSLSILLEHSNGTSKWLDVKSENAADLLSCACMLQFENAITEIEAFLHKILCPGNCLSVLSVTDVNALNGLYNKAKAMSCWYFTEVVLSEEFLQIPYHILKEYISCTMLNVSSEIVVYEAMERWITHDSKSRITHLLDLFSCLFLTTMSIKELEELQSKQLIVENISCSGQIQGLIELRGSGTAEQSSLTRKVPKIVATLCGEVFKSDCDPKYNEDVLAFDGKSFEKLTKLPFQRSYSGHKALALGKDLYIIGGGTVSPGSTKQAWQMFVFCYDTLEGYWQQVTELPTPRRHHSVLGVDQFIYVIGGFGKHRILQDTVDRYDTVNDEWEKLPCLVEPVYNAAVCTCNKNIYVIKNSVQVLKHDSEKWQHLSNIRLPFEIGILAALNVNTDIYMLGMHSKKLMRLDTLTNEVVEVGCFKSQVGFGCIYEDKIFAVFGEDSNNVETYDLKTGIFQVVYSSDFGLVHHCVLSLPRYPRFR